MFASNLSTDFLCHSE